MSPGKRMMRVNELLRRELALLCEQFIVPHLDALVTITRVETSPDLRHAKVFVSVLGSTEQRRAAMHLMQENRKHLQAEINRRLTLKYTPRLHFHDDYTAERADHVLGILRELDLPDDDAAPPSP